MNKYLLDYKYFEYVLEREFGRGLVNYRPDEFARVLLRMAKTASPDTLLEEEFVSNKIKAEAIREATNEILGNPPLNDLYDYFMTYADKLERDN